MWTPTGLLAWCTYELHGLQLHLCCFVGVHPDRTGSMCEPNQCTGQGRTCCELLSIACSVSWRSIRKSVCNQLTDNQAVSASIQRLATLYTHPMKQPLCTQYNMCRQLHACCLCSDSVTLACQPAWQSTAGLCFVFAKEGQGHHQPFALCNASASIPADWTQYSAPAYCSLQFPDPSAQPW
jgi:hypothetical protein